MKPIETSHWRERYSATLRILAIGVLGLGITLAKDNQAVSAQAEIASVGGNPATGEQASAMGKLNFGINTCSFGVAAERILYTAKHCFAGDLNLYLNPQQIDVHYTGETVANDVTIIDAQEVPNTTDMVQLTVDHPPQEFGTTVTSLPLYEQEVAVGDQVEMIGYGIDVSTPGIPGWPNVITQTVKSVGQYPCETSIDAAPLSSHIRSTGENSSVTSGDSGGLQVIAKGGRRYISGVVTAFCHSVFSPMVSVSESIYPHLNWLKAQQEKPTSDVIPPYTPVGLSINGASSGKDSQVINQEVLSGESISEQYSLILPSYGEGSASLIAENVRVTESDPQDCITGAVLNDRIYPFQVTQSDPTLANTQVEIACNDSLSPFEYETDQVQFSIDLKKVFEGGEIKTTINREVYAMARNPIKLDASSAYENRLIYQNKQDGTTIHASSDGYTVTLDLVLTSRPKQLFYQIEGGAVFGKSFFWSDPQKASEGTPINLTLSVNVWENKLRLPQLHKDNQDIFLPQIQTR